MRNSQTNRSVICIIIILTLCEAQLSVEFWKIGIMWTTTQLDPSNGCVDVSIVYVYNNVEIGDMDISK